MEIDMEIEQKLERLKMTLREMKSMVLAYSGGVDSTLLLKVAQDVLGQNLIAVTAKSPTYSEREFGHAKDMAECLGVRFISVDTSELARPEFVRNLTDRCYFCKLDLFTKLKEIAFKEGMEWVADGSNADDLEDFRPGRKAAVEMGVRSPLCEAGLTKGEIRVLSRVLGLRTWDKPPLACLASRVPYGIPIDPKALAVINQAEELLLSLGFRQVRARHHGDLVRIEVDPSEIERVVCCRKEVVEGLRALGYAFIALDLEGYRMGSLNPTHLSREAYGT